MKIPHSIEIYFIVFLSLQQYLGCGRRGVEWEGKETVRCSRDLRLPETLSEMPCGRSAVSWVRGSPEKIRKERGN